MVIGPLVDVLMGTNSIGSEGPEKWLCMADGFSSIVDSRCFGDLAQMPTGPPTVPSHVD
jgi:hypothetical protein